MATANYLVQKRMQHHGEDFVRGEVVAMEVGARDTAILQQRGFLSIVPADYPAAVRTVGEAVVSSPVSPTGDESYSDLAELMKLSRSELNTMAEQAGIENPASLDNKRAVANALIEYMSSDEESEEG